MARTEEQNEKDKRQMSRRVRCDVKAQIYGWMGGHVAYRGARVAVALGAERT